MTFYDPGIMVCNTIVGPEYHTMLMAVSLVYFLLREVWGVQNFAIRRDIFFKTPLNQNNLLAVSKPFLYIKKENCYYRPLRMEKNCQNLAVCNSSPL